MIKKNNKTNAKSITNKVWKLKYFDSIKLSLINEKNVNIPNGRVIEKIAKTNLFFLIKFSMLK